MNKYPKRLIEVDLPIKRISNHARREKSIRHGHISTLHIWWARRPLAACRAVVCASLWPDPADSDCPEKFVKRARELMLEWTSHERLNLLSPDGMRRFESARKNPKIFDDPIELRHALLDFIADFSNWDNSTVKDYLDTSRKLTQIAHESLGGVHGTKPMVIDPFAGGGAIPLESLRIGADAFASDLNTIAILLEKIIIEYLPKTGDRLLSEFQRIAGQIKSEAFKELEEFYPKSDKKIPLVYFWAKTIQCEGPGCGAIVPMLGTLWLSQKKNGSVAYKLIPDPKKKKIRFEIIKNPSKVLDGTVKRSNVICPLCDYVTSQDRVEQQMLKKRGGSKDAQLLCILWQNPSTGNREFGLPREEDILAYDRASQCLDRIQKNQKSGLSFVPNEPLPYLRSIFNVHIYGVKEWGDLFSNRQALLLGTIAKKINQFISEQSHKTDVEHKDAVSLLLMSVFGRMIDQQTTIVAWASTINAVTHTFGRQALGMVWDYVEPNLFADGGGSWDGAIDWVSRVVAHIQKSNLEKGVVELLSATQHSLPNDSVDALITDPPYYDAVPYADLSDFFYVWHKRAIGGRFASYFASQLTTKKGEAVQLAERNKEYSYKTKEYYENLMTEAFSDGRRVVKPNGIATVVFAHKTTDGWEALLSSLIKSGWKITASWPIDTERPVRLRSLNSAALASSIHLVCRPRENLDGSLDISKIGDWRDVLQELPRRMHEWMPRLAKEGVVGADAIFSCLGPALEIFSRYSSVEKSNGESVLLKEYLEQVWAAVAKEALSMLFVGVDASGLEPDARITAMWLWTLNAGNTDVVEDDGAESTNEGPGAGSTKIKSTGFVLEYDAARKIAQGLGADLERMENFVEIKGDTARLIPVEERARYLFGVEGNASVPMGSKKKIKGDKQGDFWTELMVGESKSEKKDLNLNEKFTSKPGATVLDRVHQSMILFAAGRSDALKRFLVEDGAGRDQKFWHLAQSLSALYPTQTDEKRWVDGVLARKKGLGF